MRILFVNGQAFLPQLIGGVETSTLDLCLTLQKHGHDPAIMCGLLDEQFLWLWNRFKSRVLRQQFPRDEKYGLRIYRGWDISRGLSEVFRREQPDAVVVQGGHYNSYQIAAESARLGRPTFYYCHDLGIVLGDKALPDMRDVVWIANSNYTAKVLAERLQLRCEIIAPAMRAENYRGESSRKTVTIINPRPLKGGPLAVEIAARCPDIPFLFVEAWNGSDPEVQNLKNRAATLKNVTWLPAQKDIRSIYSATRVLLAPSQCEETWGRVITEAQFLGIPALASHIGALPETVGPAGLTVAYNAEPEQWVAALRKLWDDSALYQQYADAARNYSLRDDISPDHLARKFVQILHTHTVRTA